MNHDHDQHQPGPPAFQYVLWGFIAIAGFFLLTEHRAHVLGVLPYVLLLACPLMHMFMHKHHGQGHHHESDSREDQTKGQS